MAIAIEAPAGLEGVVVANTAIGDVRGDEGFFHYRGYPAPELAVSRSLEEVWHLLQRGHLPSAMELRAFVRDTAPLRQLPPAVLAALPAIASVGTPMAGLRTAFSLAGQDSASWLDLDPDARAREALRLTAMMPALVGALWRTRRGQPVVPSDPALGIAQDYLHMISGATPADDAARAVERYLLLTIDHGFNPSTFAARVVASTGADLAATGTAGIAALSGPLHGGAPSRVIGMLDEIGTAANARPWLERELAAGRRIMGFGHRVYRTEDPRSKVLKETALALGGPVVALAVEVERVAVDILEQKYPERNLRTNVEFYAGVVLHEIGLPADLFSPSFAVSRMIGWMAHALEQMAGNRIIRPASRYSGTVQLP
ncbi:MAG: citrate/2-methylcitrate synthase [Vicinamibacterales bacterium]